jgi:hypothetical protein
MHKIVQVILFTIFKTILSVWKFLVFKIELFFIFYFTCQYFFLIWFSILKTGGQVNSDLKKEANTILYEFDNFMALDKQYLLYDNGAKIITKQNTIQEFLLDLVSFFV